MKLLSIAIPCYHSQEYMAHAIESLLPGGEEVEILIVDDGSRDETAKIADAYAERYPTIVRAIHQENAGHGGAVMTGLRNATGLYFKVVDSDDWVDAEAYPKVLETLRQNVAEPLDMLVSNYIYDKLGEKHKHVVRYHHALPRGKIFGWQEVRRFNKGQYLLMHAVIYCTGLLRECGLELPLHTFYVDELYVYKPLTHVKRMLYLDVDFYHYFIGRDDQSVQEAVMLCRIDQYLLVNRLLVTCTDPFQDENKTRRRYMLSYLEIITTISSVLLIKSGTEENLQKARQLWAWLRQEHPRLYRTLRRRTAGILIHLPGGLRRFVLTKGYELSRKIFGFN